MIFGAGGALESVSSVRLRSLSWALKMNDGVSRIIFWKKKSGTFYLFTYLCIRYVKYTPSNAVTPSKCLKYLLPASLPLADAVQR
jgi:hypothetical protein